MELPEGFAARPLLRSDLDDVYAVAEAYDIEMLGEPDLEKADIEAYWKMPNFHLDTDSLGVFDGSRLTAYTEVMMGKYVVLCVHADYRGRGIGTALGRWSEDRLRAMGAGKAIQSAPVTDKAALRIFADRGYDLGWTSWALALPSDVTIPQRELADGYAVRPFMPGIEDEAVYEVIQVAFGEWPDRERTPYEDWRAVVFEREGFNSDNMLVATHGDEIIGVCFVIDRERAGWVNSLGVDNAHRHRGIAQILLARAFEGTRSRGLKRAELATDARTGALGLYENLGMHVTQTYEEWSLEL
ncbi:MAG: GNAT family N-acetyltransferase [Kineosporiaceae bacterium]|nr:GNAT family N-acetyltransferase [Aeromicrobium sp.]